MSRIAFNLFAILATTIFSGCSSVGPAKLHGNKPVASLKSAYVVVATGGNPNIGGFIQGGLARQNIKTAIGALKDKPADVDFFVNYKERWNWDITVYLESLDVEFVDNADGKIIATSQFRQGLFHSFPDPRTKTFEVIDSIFNAK